jgi:hypothetical protein
LLLESEISWCLADCQAQTPENVTTQRQRIIT